MMSSEEREGAWYDMRNRLKLTAVRMPSDRELANLLHNASPPTEEQMTEQAVSFVYGNAPVNSNITKESARRAVNCRLLID